MNYLWRIWNWLELAFLIILYLQFLLFSLEKCLRIKLTLGIFNFIKETSSNLLNILDSLIIPWKSHIMESFDCSFFFGRNFKVWDIVLIMNIEVIEKNIDGFNEFFNSFYFTIWTALVKIVISHWEENLRHITTRIKTLTLHLLVNHFLIILIWFDIVLVKHH